MDIVGPQTNPDGMSVITVRVIKSFEFRTSKNLIIKVDLSQTTVGNLKDACRE
ncbi:hypothetical protein GGI05_005352, partial [Coemansia sp. RSA 2603]